MSCCLIGLGANLGNRQAALLSAAEELRRHPAISSVVLSPLFETPPAGGPAGQPPYLNAAIRAETSLPPLELLELLLRIETNLGRRREERWGPRTIDLDLLLYDRVVLNSADLVVPHPRMAWRRFVLAPAACVAGDMLHPNTGWTVARLLEHISTAPSYVAIAGPAGVGKTTLARRFSRQFDARPICDPIDAEVLEAFYADPAGRAWRTELHFLSQRSKMLNAGSPDWADRSRLTVSDFWFRQSLAYARARLDPPQFEAFYERWNRADREIARPQLIVILDGPAIENNREGAGRDRLWERNVEVEQRERIRQFILDESQGPNLGPVLRLKNDDLDAAACELLAAAQAMREL
jgi:2-amino-4-hydroxy-6-hydroxymethyldihydropteridine diphosphokinase